MHTHECVVGCSSYRAVSHTVAVIDGINNTGHAVRVLVYGSSQTFSLIMGKWTNRNNYLQNVNVDHSSACKEHIIITSVNDLSLEQRHKSCSHWRAEGCEIQIFASIWYLLGLTLRGQVHPRF